MFYKKSINATATNLKNCTKIYFKNEIANKFLTYFCNLISGLNLSDVEVGYKLIKTSILKKLNLKENSFGFEIEVTMKLAKKKCKIFEVGISYNGRTYAECKKIQTIDGILAIFYILKYKLWLKIYFLRPILWAIKSY
jgi:hypothetical protein